MLIPLDKQRENVKNAGRVNKRHEGVRGETIPVDCDVTLFIERLSPRLHAKI